MVTHARRRRPGLRFGVRIQSIHWMRDPDRPFGGLNRRSRVDRVRFFPWTVKQRWRWKIDRTIVDECFCCCCTGDCFGHDEWPDDHNSQLDLEGYAHV